MMIVAILLIGDQEDRQTDRETDRKPTDSERMSASEQPPQLFLHLLIRTVLYKLAIAAAATPSPLIAS